MIDQTKLVLDIRKAGLIITSKIILSSNQHTEQQDIHFGSVMYIDSKTYDLNILNEHKLYLDLSTQTLQTLLKSQKLDKQESMLIFDKIKTEEQQLQFSTIFANQLYEFCANNIAGQITIIQLVKNEIISDNFYYTIKQAISNVFKVIPEDLYPQKMLAIDMGTGYYMLTLSEIVYQYNQFKQSYFVSEPGNLNKSHKLQQKVESDIYFAPEFNFQNVPYYIATGQINLILGNTALGSFSEIPSGWYLIKHYKKHLYEDNQNIYFDKYRMNSGIIIPYQVSETETRYIDVVHIFLVFLLHIKHAIDIVQLKFDVIKASIPIKSVQKQESIMKHCFQFIFQNVDVITTSEPEAAFGEIILQKQLNISDKFDHLMILDGGDGTFDYLYIQKFINQQNNQIIWQQKAKDVSIEAGSLLYQKLHEYIINNYIIEEDKHKVLEIMQFTNDIFMQIVKSTDQKAVKIILKKQWVGLLSSLLANKDNGILLQFVVNSVTSERFNQVINNIISAGETELLQRFRGLCQWPCVLNQEVVECVYREPIQRYVINFANFYTMVQQEMIQQDKWPSGSPGILFIGGLAQNPRIFEQIKLKAAELDAQLIDSITNPQVIVIKGIPIDRINITARNLDAIAQENLYLCYTKHMPELSLQKMLYVRSVDTGAEAKYRCSKMAIYATKKLLSIGDVLAPGYPVKKLTKQNLAINEVVKLVLYKTKNEAPVFLSLAYNDETSSFMFQQREKIFNDNNLWYSEIFITEQDVLNIIQVLNENQHYDLIRLLDNQLIQGKIPVSIYVVMDNIKFKTKPTIQVFYDFEDENQDIARYFFKQIDFFDWYQNYYQEDTYQWDIQQENTVQ